MTTPTPPDGNRDVGMFTGQPEHGKNRSIAILAVSGLFAAVVGALVVAVALGGERNKVTPTPQIVPVTTTTTTTEKKATTTTVDLDAACKAALRQTADINLPFQSCTGAQYDRLHAVYGPGKPDRRYACEYANMGPACADIPVTTTTSPPPPPTTRPPATTPIYDDPVLGPEVQRIALDSMWDNQSWSEQQTICDGVDMFGMDYALDIFMQSANDGEDYFDRWVVRDWLSDMCTGR